MSRCEYCYLEYTDDPRTFCDCEERVTCNQCPATLPMSEMTEIEGAPGCYLCPDCIEFNMEFELQEIIMAENAGIFLQLTNQLKLSL